VSSSERELTTTSYAILGLLAVRPWSTYELARQMRRNLHYFWPRAESNVYAEPKRLVTGGFARASAEPVGRRRRTVYSITPKGRRALGAWLATPPADPRLESEALVKLAFASNGTKVDLLANLQRFREQTEAKRGELRAIFEEYVRGEDPFPERIHINVVAYRLLWQTAQVELEWADWAIAEVERWDDTKTAPSRGRLVRVLVQALRHG
jgi:PadR family transcriptional regulator, regulatory protein AphA